MSTQTLKCQPLKKSTCVFVRKISRTTSFCHSIAITMMYLIVRNKEKKCTIILGTHNLT